MERGYWQYPVIQAGRQGPVHWHNTYSKGKEGISIPSHTSGQAGKAQTPLPSRASTRTSRGVGITQGNLPHTRETTGDSRMQEVCTEWPCYHSLNRWRERTALVHRHAGMSMGSEPCTLIGIPSKGAWALMTRHGPSPEEGPGAQPHIRIRGTPNMTVSFQFIYITEMNPINRAVAPVSFTVYSVFYQEEEDNS